MHHELVHPVARLISQTMIRIVSSGHTLAGMIRPSIACMRSSHTSNSSALASAMHRTCKRTTSQCYAKLRALYLASAMLAISFHVTARDMQQIETELVAEVRIEEVTATHRRARFVPATVVAQGEVVYYTVRIRNVSTEYARGVTVTQRIPSNTVYVAGSASAPNAEVTFSIDGGQTFAREQDLRVVDGDGVLRPAPMEQYTHIRWRLRNPLAPGAVALARFRAQFQ